MNQSQFNDQMLQFELRRLNNSLQEAFDRERVEGQQRYEQLQQEAVTEVQRLHELLQQAAADTEAERTHAGRMERWADFVVQRADWTSNQLGIIKREFEEAEQRLADGITEAIAPVTPDHTCTNCFTDTGPCTGQCAATAEPARVDPVEPEPTLVPEIDLPDDKHSLID